MTGVFPAQRRAPSPRLNSSLINLEVPRQYDVGLDDLVWRLWFAKSPRNRRLASIPVRPGGRCFCPYAMMPLPRLPGRPRTLRCGLARRLCRESIGLWWGQRQRQPMRWEWSDMARHKTDGNQQVSWPAGNQQVTSRGSQYGVERGTHRFPQLPAMLVISSRHACVTYYTGTACFPAFFATPPVPHVVRCIVILRPARLKFLRRLITPAIFSSVCRTAINPNLTRRNRRPGFESMPGGRSPTRHYCDYAECGKSFRRAEHLTRHKLNRMGFSMWNSGNGVDTTDTRFRYRLHHPMPSVRPAILPKRPTASPYNLEAWQIAKSQRQSQRRPRHPP